VGKKLDWTTDMIKHFDRESVSNIVLFETNNESNSRFYFVGVHNHYNPIDSVTQDAHMNYLLKLIKRNTVINDYPVIMCGDFNATPSHSVYDIIYKNKYESVYKKFYGEEAKYTFASEHFRGAMDYIFVNDKCKINNVKEIDFDYLEKNNIPNDDFPSDHMYLFADIKI
jgi:endonuclease/exonuclease/phosphatase family metal-dependent hydrolase